MVSKLRLLLFLGIVGALALFPVAASAQVPCSAAGFAIAACDADADAEGAAPVYRVDGGKWRYYGV